MAGRSLGKVWLAIGPDLGKFGIETKAGLKRQLAGVAGQVAVTANTTPAVAGLDRVKAKLADLARQRAGVTIAAKDKDALAAAARVDLAFARLDKAVARPKIDLTGIARAEAQVAELDLALDKLSRKTAAPGVREKGSRVGSLGGLAGAASVTGLAGIVAGGLGILPAVTAAGLGVASFGALALPVIKGISTAMTQVTADTNTYDRATTKAGRNTALIHIREDWAKLTPAQRDAVKGIQGLKAEFGKLSAALAPLTLRVLNDGLKLANGLLPDLAPFAQAAGRALDGLLTSAGKFTRGAGFRGFVTELAKLSGPAITTIGEAVGKIAIAAGKLLRSVASPGGMAVFAGAVAGLATAVTGLAAGFAFLAKHVSPAIMHDLGTAILAVYGAVKLWGIAQAALDALLAANPIGLAVAAVAALAAGFIIAWRNSATFRDVIKSLATVMLGVGIVILKVNKSIVDAFLSVIGTILHGLADAFGWIPGGVGKSLKAASKSFDGFKAGTDGVITGLIGRMQDWQGALGKSRTTVAQATAAIVADFRGQGKAALLGRDDVAAYSVAVQSQGSKSDAARSARQRLITDLENSGVSARNARGLVDGLQGAIDRMHGKNVPVGVTGSGSGGVVITTSGIAAAGQGNVRFHAARGMFVRDGSGPTADDVPAMLSRGELVVPAGMVRAGAVDHLRGKLPGFAGGGFVGMESALGRVTDAAAGTEGRGAAAGMAAGVKAAIAREKAAMSKAFTAAKVPDAGSGVARWAGTVRQALAMEGLNPALVLAVLYQMMTESGGNPNAINLTDINAQHGDPSRGLMQVIGSTFRAYHWPGTSGNIYDPLANVAAAVNYARHRYGPSLMSGGLGIGSGHGYAAGGLVPGYASGGRTVPLPVPVPHLGSYFASPAALRAALAAAQKGEQAKYFGLGHSFALGFPHAPKGSWLAGHRGALSGELAALGSRQHAEQAAYARLSGSGLSPANLGKLGQAARAESLLALADTALSHPAAAGNLGGHPLYVRDMRAMLARLQSVANAGGTRLPVLGPVAHTYGGDAGVADSIGAYLQSVMPFARGGMLRAASYDHGGYLPVGTSLAFNGTGRPEPVGAQAVTVNVQLEWVSRNGGDELLALLRKAVKVRGGGNVQRALGTPGTVSGSNTWKSG